MGPWSIQKSIELYGTQYWGNDFFQINEKGNVSITPDSTKEHSIDLKELTEDLQERGIRLPILIRFPDIVGSRIRLLSDCFAKAMNECNYQADYMGVYPIKVNQHKDLVKQVVDYGRGTKLGLEAGSKPELLVVLAMMENPNGLVICNGFKDEEYVETALLSQKIGRNTIVVVDRMDELPIILKVAKKLNIKPRIGLRVKLYSKGAGKWIDSSGARSKFGLTPPEVCEALERLKKDEMMDCLELVHFHIGSQIPSIASIKSSLKEGARYYAELRKMGAEKLCYMDVGGGLGVDYDGTGKSNSSTNYSEQEYANDVVYTVQQVCDQHEVPHPNIVTESGRALVAHHSVLLMNVLGTNEVTKKGHNVVADRKDSPIIHNLLEIFDNLHVDHLNEAFNDVMEMKEDSLKLFTLGYLSLSERAKSEELIWANLTRILELAHIDTDEYEDLILKLEDMLSDTYFTNFSIFQSIPDSWAVGHHFPVMPIHRLNEEPSKKAILVDLTCDSDGKVDQFVEYGVKSKSLSVHPLLEDEEYYMGFFMVGAYQEALGDLHNLFGDTDAVDVSLTDSGAYKVTHVSEGDTVAEVLSYLHYHRAELVNSIRNAIETNIVENRITSKEAKLLMRHYDEGLSGYTYLE
jgi:arginine decarboxylase